MNHRPTVRELVAFWLGTRTGFRLEFLADEFTYDHPLEKMSGTDFALRIGYGGAWSSVVEIAHIQSESVSAIVVEATDDVTLLRHRISWVVEYSGQAVTRIVATSCGTLA